MSIRSDGSPGHPYGSQYHTVRDRDGNPMVYENIKFVQKNKHDSEPLLETMTEGRIYVEVNSHGDIAYIHYYDESNKRYKQINLRHSHSKIRSVRDGKKYLYHTHHGYEGKEYEVSAKGGTPLTEDEWRMVDRVFGIWETRTGGA